jgi:hypothetical protein
MTLKGNPILKSGILPQEVLNDSTQITVIANLTVFIMVQVKCHKTNPKEICFWLFAICSLVFWLQLCQ